MVFQPQLCTVKAILGWGQFCYEFCYELCPCWKDRSLNRLTSNPTTNDNKEYWQIVYSTDSFALFFSGYYLKHKLELSSIFHDYAYSIVCVCQIVMQVINDDRYIMKQFCHDVIWLSSERKFITFEYFTVTVILMN